MTNQPGLGILRKIRDEQDRINSMPSGSEKTLAQMALDKLKKQSNYDMLSKMARDL